MAQTGFNPQDPFAGAGTLQMIGTPTDYITGGREYRINPSHGNWSGILSDFNGNDGIPDHVAIHFLDDDLGNQQTGGFWHLDFGVDKIPGTALAVGTYVNAQRASFADAGHPGIDVTGDGRGCNTISGRFEITAFEYDCIITGSTATFHLTRFAATFQQHCEAGQAFLRGSIDYTAPASGETCDGSDGGGDGGTDGGDDTPEPEPPPPVQVVFPTEVWAAPIHMDNAATRTIAFDTAIDSTFNSDLQLSVVTNASPSEDFHAEITPSVIAAPGAASGTVKITTGAMTFPRTYTVTVLAFDGTTFHDSSFLVEVQCTPPFILGVDQPQSVAASAGNVELQAKPSGSGPFTYQWYRGFRGMTRDAVTTTGAKLTVPNDGSSYWVRVRNACGSVDSEVVRANVP